MTQELERPWGKCMTLWEDVNFTVRRLVVNPGATINLQSHEKRKEHWVIVRGAAFIEIHNTVTFHYKDDYIFIPMGEKHRLKNVGNDFLEIVEIQTGSYFGEDDIVRYENEYETAA